MNFSKYSVISTIDKQYFREKFTKYRKMFERKCQINVWYYTKSEDRNPIFNTPFVFNEIGLNEMSLDSIYVHKLWRNLQTTEKSSKDNHK